jgi:diadenylate cyclase
VLRLPSDAGELDMGLQPRGYRLLAKVPRLPDAVVERIVDRFGSLHKILRASVADLDEVEGVGETRAKAIEESLRRLAETSILDRYG